jgi:hypothetical protein
LLPDGQYLDMFDSESDADGAEDDDDDGEEFVEVL